MLDDPGLDRDDRPSVADAIEWLADSVFSTLAKLLMPWRWFSHNDGGKLGSRRRVSEGFRWRMAMVVEFVADKFYRLLDLPERATSWMLHIAAKPGAWLGAALMGGRPRVKQLDPPNQKKREAKVAAKQPHAK